MADQKMKALFDYLKNGYTPGDSLQEFQDTLAKIAADAEIDTLDYFSQNFTVDGVADSETISQLFVSPDNCELVAAMVAKAGVVAVATVNVQTFDKLSGPPLGCP